MTLVPFDFDCGSHQSITTTTVTKASTMTVNKAHTPCVSDSGPINPTTPLVSFLDKLQGTALTTFGKKKIRPEKLRRFVAEARIAGDSEGFWSAATVSRWVRVGQRFEGVCGWILGGCRGGCGGCRARGFRPGAGGVPANGEAPGSQGLGSGGAFPLEELEQEGLWWGPQVAHSVLPLPEQFVIPGSRFREVYYWDSYWVIRQVISVNLSF